MMTRKDYVKTAEILKHSKEYMPHSTYLELVHDFADMFADDNPNFNEFKFQQACDLDIREVPNVDEFFR